MCDNKTTVADFNQLLLDHNVFTKEASEIMLSLTKNCNEFLFELTEAGIEKARKNEEDFKIFNESKKHTQQIVKYVDQVHTEIHALSEAVQESDLDTKNCQEKCESLEAELEKTSRLLEEAIKKIEKMKTEKIIQANFTASLGSTCCTMLWKTSKTEEIIEKFIAEDTLPEFFKFSLVTVRSFFESYGDELPSIESQEYKFILSIIGVEINISAQINGRNQILREASGQSFIVKTLYYLGKIPLPTGLLLKRMFLIFLYNISICKKGALIILGSKIGIENILKCLGREYNMEIQSIVLTLMNSIFDEFSTDELKISVRNLIAHQNLLHLMESKDKALSELSLKFYGKIYSSDFF